MRAARNTPVMRVCLCKVDTTGLVLDVSDGEYKHGADTNKPDSNTTNQSTFHNSGVRTSSPAILKMLICVFYSTDLHIIEVLSYVSFSFSVSSSLLLPSWPVVFTHKSQRCCFFFYCSSYCAAPTIVLIQLLSH